MAEMKLANILVSGGWEDDSNSYPQPDNYLLRDLFIDEIRDFVAQHRGRTVTVIFNFRVEDDDLWHSLSNLQRSDLLGRLVKAEELIHTLLDLFKQEHVKQIFNPMQATHIFTTPIIKDHTIEFNFDS